MPDRVGWTPYGDGTLDRLDREHAAALEREVRHSRRLDVQHEKARRYRHRFVPDDLFPGFCETCGFSLARHEMWVQ